MQIRWFIKENICVQEEWESFLFRDCNGVSNGIDLPLVVVQLEESLGGIAGKGLDGSRSLDISEISQQKTKSLFSTGRLH